jgi:hypothetical protein
MRSMLRVHSDFERNVIVKELEIPLTSGVISQDIIFSELFYGALNIGVYIASKSVITDEW